MSSFTSFGGSSTPISGDMESKKNAVMDQVRSELALANAQELINKMNEKCFAKCIMKPSTRLESSEQICISKCMDRYMEAWNIVSRSYIGRVQRETQNRPTDFGM